MECIRDINVKLDFLRLIYSSVAMIIDVEAISWQRCFSGLYIGVLEVRRRYKGRTYEKQVREMHSIYRHDFCTLDVSLSWDFRESVKHDSLDAPTTRVGVGLVEKSSDPAQSHSCIANFIEGLGV